MLLTYQENIVKQKQNLLCLLETALSRGLIAELYVWEQLVPLLSSSDLHVKIQLYVTANFHKQD